MGDQVLAFQQLAALQHALLVSVQVPDPGVAPAAEVGVGPRTKADIGPQQPIAQVVPGGEARLCKVGDLILLIARLGQPVHRPQVHVGLGVVVGEDLSGRHAGGEGGALLHLQPVAGQVLRPQGQGVLHRLLPAGEGLTGQAVNQVQREVLKARPPNGLYGGGGLLRRVNAANLPQLLAAGGLHPQGDAVKPRPPQGF